MKQFCTVIAAAAAAAALSGTANSEATTTEPTDAQILNYALTLEHLEATFYQEGLKNYTQQDFLTCGFHDPFYENLQRVASDEKNHVQFLTKALIAAGATPVEACQYSFPAVDVKSFVALANILEGVGVSAYLGAAAHIMNKTYVTAAGSILTVEARHSAYLRASLRQVPFAQPFDNPLDLNEVYTLASPFFVSCPPSNPKLPVKAFPSLSVSPTGSIMANSTITLTPGTMFNSGNGDVYAAFITVTGPVFVSLNHSDSMFILEVPDTVAGQSYVVLTSSNSTVNDDNVLAGPAIVEITFNWVANKFMNPTMSPSATMKPSMTAATMRGQTEFTGFTPRLMANIDKVAAAAAIAVAALT